MFDPGPDGPLGSRHGYDTHLARALGVPRRHPGRQAHLRRPVPERQPEVPREREGTGARRRDLHHPRAQRPRRRHARPGEEVPVPRGCSGRASRLPLDARRRRGRRRARPEQGRHGRPGRDQGHARARAALVQLHDRGAGRLGDGVGDRLHRRAVRARLRLRRGTQALLRRRHERLRRHGADRAPLRAGRRDSPDRRPLHDGSEGGGGRVRAARREALRAVPLRHVPDPRGDARAAARAGARSRGDQRPSRADRSSCERALVRRDRAPRARSSRSRARSTSRARSSSTTSRIRPASARRTRRGRRSSSARRPRRR